MTARIVSIASGKGGVGKTNVAVNLALALGAAGARVCLLDADLGLSNVDILLGLEPRHSLDDVLFSGLAVEDCLLPIRPNVHLLPGSSGVARLASLDRERRAMLAAEFSKLTAFDYLLVDNSPGIIPTVLSLCLSAHELLVLATPEAAAITDAYALLKVLREQGLLRRPLLLINRARSARHAEAVFSRLRDTAREHLGLGCLPLGWLPDDPAVGRASLQREPVLETEPEAPFSRLLRRAAARLMEQGAKGRAKSRGTGPELFLEQSITRLQATAPQGAPLPSLQPRAAQALGDMEAALAVLDGLRPHLGGHVQKALDALHSPRSLLAELAGELRPRQAQPPAGERPRALVLCREQNLRELLCDLAAEAGLAPVLSWNGTPGEPALVLLAQERQEEAAGAHWLQEPGRAPVLLLQGYGESPALPGHVTLLRKPFAVQDFLAVAGRLAGLSS